MSLRSRVVRNLRRLLAAVSVTAVVAAGLVVVSSVAVSRPALADGDEVCGTGPADWQENGPVAPTTWTGSSAVGVDWGVSLQPPWLFWGCQGSTPYYAQAIVTWPDLSGYPDGVWLMVQQSCDGWSSGSAWRYLKGPEWGGGYLSGAAGLVYTDVGGSMPGSGGPVCTPGDVLTVDVGYEVASTSPATYSGATTMAVMQFRYGGPVPGWSFHRTTAAFAGANPATNLAQCSEHEPVECASGDMWHTFDDVAVPGRGGGLSLSRTYNSLSASSGGPFGYGWSCSFCAGLSIDAGSGEATVTHDNGSHAVFEPDGSGGFTPGLGVHASLAHNPDGTYTYVLRGRERYTFAASGALLAQADLDGDTTTYGYTGSRVSSISDGAGRSIDLSYNSDGLVSSVTDPLGRQTTYGYDSAGNLTASTDPAGHTTTLGYDSHHLLTSITAPDGGVVTTGYDGDGRAVSQTDAMGRTTAWAYAGDAFSDQGGVTTITEPDGEEKIEQYVDGALTQLTRNAGAASAATWRYGIDFTTGATLSVTDPLGHVTRQAFDAAGNLASVTDADGRTTSWTYDGLGDVLTKTDAAGVTTTYTYTAGGDVASTSTPLGSGAVTTSNVYGDPAHPGDVTSSVDADGETTSHTYDSYGDMTSTTDPDGDMTTATFDADGEQLTTTDGDGNVAGCGCAAAHTTGFAYNPDGTLASTTDPLGQTTSYGYDANGNLTTVTDPTGLTTTTTFDADNEPTLVTRPDGSTVAYGYDADGRRDSVANGTDPATVSTFDALGDVLTVTDPAGNVTRHAYDLAGRLTSTTSPDGGVTSYGYDPAGQLTSVTSPTGGVTTRGYDVDGRLASTTDPDGNVTSYAYDALGRQTTTTQADGTTTVNVYDPAGRLVGFTDAGGHATTHSYSPAGRELSSTDADNRTTSYGYDASGNQTTVTDPTGRVTTQTFDAAGELTGVSFSDGTTPAVTYGYDAAGRRTSMTDATGTTSYGYDTHGNLRTVTDGSGRVVTYGLNGNDQITSVGYPDGHAVTRSYDPAGRLASVTDWNNQTTSFGWDGDGDLTSTTFPNGVTQATTVDAADQPTAITVSNAGGTLASFGYTPDAAGLLASSTDSLEPSLSTSYGHTKLNQLGSVASAPNSYGYDNAGNLTGLDDGTSQTFDPAGQLLTASNPTIGSTSFGYDASGERVTATGATTATYGFDQTGQLTSSDTAGGQAGYSYDGDGLRATAVNTTATGTSSRAFSWDQLTAAVPVVLSDGVDDYVYGPGDTPVEQVDHTTGTTSYLHTDRIGSVRLVTDSSGAVAATASYTPYGLPLTTGGATAATPFGFSGEYTDPSGLIYLRARYYDPATGQFLTVDPAVDSTHSPYLYVGGDPINLTDPSGLKCHGWSLNPACDVGQGWHDTLGQHWRGAAQVGIGVAATAATVTCIAITVGICGGAVATIATTTAIGAAAGAANYAVSGGCHTTEGYLVSAGVGGLLGGVGGGVGEYASGAVDLVNGTAAVGGGGAYETALAGGRHAGFLANYAGRATSEIESGISSIEKQIAQHQSWIENPYSKIADWDKLDPREQSALINSKWPGDIARQQEQLQILRGILEGRG